MDEIDQLLKKTFTSEYRTGYINLKGYCLTEHFIPFADDLENFEVRDDDIWICSFPKAGTTWTQEMVWCIKNDLDFERATNTFMGDRFPFLELVTLFKNEAIKLKIPEAESETRCSIDYIKKLSSPRFIKSHLPFELLPRQIRTGERKPKMLYITRNPKDTCISYYHHTRLVEFYRGDFDQFCTLCLAGKLLYAPYWNHVLSYWNRRNLKNILIIKFEDMKAVKYYIRTYRREQKSSRKDLPSIIIKVATFLGEQLNENQVNILEDHLSFSNMKANPSVNREGLIQILKEAKLNIPDGKFMRCGKVNQWKDEMPTEVIEQFDKLTKQHFEMAELHF